jgi:hypothetical protein
MGEVIPIRRQRTSEWLETLARKPWAYNRESLLELVERFRAIEALEDHDRARARDGRDQLDLGEAA